MDRGASAAMLVIEILKEVLVSNNGEVCYPWGRFDAMVRYTEARVAHFRAPDELIIVDISLSSYVIEPSMAWALQHRCPTLLAGRPLR
jgi:hypothetical protein